MAQLAFPRVRVRIERPGSDDIVEVIVQTDNRDAVRFDLLRARKSFPGMSDAPLLWATVLAWSAVMRSDRSLLPEDVEKALDVIVEVQPVDEDGDPVEMGDPAALVPVDPTQTDRPGD